MLMVELVEVGQLLNARCAVGRPEIDDCRLSAGVGEMELTAVQAGDRKVRKLHADIVAHRHGRRLCFRPVLRLCCLIDRRACGRRGIALRFLHVLHRGVQEVEPQQGKAQNRQCDSPGNTSGTPASGRCVLRLAGNAALRRFQGDLPSFQADCLLRTDIHALGAVNALMVAHMPHIHATVAHTRAAAVAPAFVHADSDQTEAVEEAVDRPQRTDKAAEAAIAEDTGQSDNQHDDKLACKEDVQHAEQIGVARIGEQPDGAFKGTRRADIFAEAGQRHIMLQSVPQRDRYDEHRQQNVLQPGQRPGNPALLELECGNLVEQLLNQSQRTEPAADRSSEDHAEEQKDAHHIPSGPVSGGCECVLNGAERTCTDRARAGIAVESGDTGVFCLPLIDFTVNKAFDVCVVQQRTVKLNQSSGRRTVRLPPCCFHIIQGLHTPYRFLPLFRKHLLRFH